MEFIDARDARDAKDDMDRTMVDGRELQVVFAQVRLVPAGLPLHSPTLPSHTHTQPSVRVCFFARDPAVDRLWTA